MSVVLVRRSESIEIGRTVLSTCTRGLVTKCGSTSYIISGRKLGGSAHCRSLGQVSALKGARPEGGVSTGRAAGCIVSPKASFDHESNAEGTLSQG